jgi:vacuolar-type H+-ATPase subunit H
MEIREIVEELEGIAAGGTKMPGMKRVMVDANRLVEVVAELRESMPTQIQEANEIVRQKDSIINQTHLEARRIKESASNESERIKTAAHEEHHSRVGETEIVKAAEAKADEINQQALQDAQQIVQDAQRKAYMITDEVETASEDRREGASQYARETLFDLEERLSELVGQVRRGIDALGLEAEVEARVEAKVEVNGTTNGTAVK